MEPFSPEFWSALGAIILIDLVLAGDNAIVIALAARNLPPDLQKKAIFWGTFGAIAVRSAMTMVVVWLLNIPGLMLAGGLALLYIAVTLLIPEKQHEEGHSTNTNFWNAMKTIVVADALMGLDNVLGVAGAAQGNMMLVVLGLLISIPIVIFGSSIVLKLIERFPIIMYIGAGVLGLTAAIMIMKEPLLKGFLNLTGIWMYGFYALCIAGVIGVGHYLAQRAVAKNPTLG